MIARRAATATGSPDPARGAAVTATGRAGGVIGKAEDAIAKAAVAASEAAAGESGGFFFDRKRRRTHLLPFTRETPGEREALWTLCEEVTEQT